MCEASFLGETSLLQTASLVTSWGSSSGRVTLIIPARHRILGRRSRESPRLRNIGDAEVEFFVPPTAPQGLGEVTKAVPTTLRMEAPETCQHAVEA